MLIRSVRRRPLLAENHQLQTLHPVIQRILLARGITSLQAIEYELKNLLPPDDLLNIRQAAELVAEMILAQRRILIIGDFDADGATATALLMKALPQFGAKNIDFLVPDRFNDGYGLSESIVNKAARKKPDLIVTVDNGIANHAGVKLAKSMGIKVLITDHHLPAETLPEADIIVNPNQPDDQFASKNLAGVGVAFYLCLALRQHFREGQLFKRLGLAEPNLASLIDLVALGTVADVVPLDTNNRILVEQGLRRIRQNACSPGVRALLHAAGRNPSKANAQDFGFCVGPRLNAAGRLEDMTIGIRCLLAENDAQAMPLAERLDRLNRERRQIEADMLDEAEQSLRQIKLPQVDGRDDRPNTICLYQPHWHQGVIGILASRVKEKLNRPTIIFAQDEDESLIKGSARSVPGLHMRDLLALVDARHPGIIVKFGGHAMAAGLTLRADAFETFVKALEQEAKNLLGHKVIEDIIETDGAPDADCYSLDFAKALQRLGPFGQGFAAPSFDDKFEVVACSLVGENHLKLRLKHGAVSQLLDAIYFRAPANLSVNTGDRVHAVFSFDVNEYQGLQRLQLIIEQLQPL